MSYRAPDQSIECPAREIISGIAAFDGAVSARIKSGEWDQDHIAYLCELRTRLVAIKGELEQLAETTW